MRLSNLGAVVSRAERLKRLQDFKTAVEKGDATSATFTWKSSLWTVDTMLSTSQIRETYLALIDAEIAMVQNDLRNFGVNVEA